MTTKNPHQVQSGRSSIEEAPQPALQASVEWSFPIGDGWHSTGWTRCEHHHRTVEAARACRDRLAARIERDPMSVPDIAWAIRQRAEEGPR